MREFEFIDRVMPDVPPPAPEQVAAVRDRLARRAGSASLRRDRPVRRAGSASPRRPRLGGWKGVALAAAAVILVIGAVAVLLPASTPAPVVTTPRQVLDAAADRLARQPLPVRRYWRQETERIMRTEGADGYRVEERGRDVLAFGRDGDWYTWYESVSTEPYGAEATEQWRRSGSPKLCPGRGCDPHLPAYPARSMDRPLAVAPGWTATLAEVLALPGEAAALRAELLEHYTDNSEASPDQWLGEVARRLVVELPISPGTQAAAYRVLAGLPGASVRDDVHDPGGRPAVTLELPPRGAVRVQLVIDPGSGALRAAQQVAPMPGLDPGVPSVITVIVARSWTDTRPVPPSGCRNCSGRY
ncbi:CU044_5270 family protein [Nonomuraea gerenzanensis]|uniref:CU044_5270 family protein n=1 Tax=Nonomuraea gerenzanensis TaxID=93944 RepID=A0A1M4EQR0_9ACTN|nr:CU044_5270 family protein [Nonomuraea gerenzanensis]UBU12620.1 CU044_5270 family protein [Nonomuraea gerenzanensis]SBP01176.1 hypothetical protein BN4615_P10692 [Nonomuraea gerenzanensis]